MAEYIVAIDVTRARFPADALLADGSTVVHDRDINCIPQISAELDFSLDLNAYSHVTSGPVV